MLLDERTEFCDNVALPTGSTGRTILGDNLDQSIVNAMIAEGVALVVQATEDVTSAGAATVTFELLSDASGTIATDGSATYHGGLGPIPVASLTAGRQLAIPLPPGPYERYVGLAVNVGTAALTGGRINAFLTSNPASHL